MVAKHFTGLEEISFQLTKKAPGLWVHDYEHPVLEENITELRRMLNTLLKCQHLKKIDLVSQDMIDMNAAAKRILETRPEASKILRMRE
jgi:hypothetical protein